MRRLGRRRLAPSSLRLFRLAAVELERLLGAGGRLVLAALPVEVDDEIPDRGRLRCRRWQDVQHVLVFTVRLVQNAFRRTWVRSKAPASCDYDFARFEQSLHQLLIIVSCFQLVLFHRLICTHSSCLMPFVSLGVPREKSVGDRRIRFKCKCGGLWSFFAGHHRVSRARRGTMEH